MILSIMSNCRVTFHYHEEFAEVNYRVKSEFYETLRKLLNCIAPDCECGNFKCRCLCPCICQCIPHVINVYLID